MRQFLVLVLLCGVSLPMGMSIAGCRNNNNAYCDYNGHSLPVNAVAYINLEPHDTGISLAYGQTTTLRVPQAFNCRKDPAGSGHFTYGTSDSNLVDLSPTGSICAGRWNRNSAGGVADYTICTPPTRSGIALITAEEEGVPSNNLPIYVHPQISSISIPTQTGCISQNKTLNDANGNPVSLSSLTHLFGPDGKEIDKSVIGFIQFTPVNANIVSIDNTIIPGVFPQSGIATAQQPGSTAITATVGAGLGSTISAAGYFYTCPPANISLSYASNGGTSATVIPGTPQSLKATITDIHGVQLSGLTLDYSSTNPSQIGVDGAGLVTSTFSGNAAISAICQPPGCNPSPVNQIGKFGSGTPVISNSVLASSPGRNSTYLWIGSPASRDIVQVDLTTGTVGAQSVLPYYPNSMLLERNGFRLFVGSYRELMIFNAASNVLADQDISVPGTVLALSPDGSQILIDDQVRQVFYLYDTNKKAVLSTYGGLATRAAFTPDGKTIYAAGPNNLYVFSVFTGWSTYDISGNQSSGQACMAANNLNNAYAFPGAPSPVYNPFCAPDLALTIPAAGAFLSGSATTAHAFCPDQSSNPYYPLSATVAANTEQVASTNDGQHILGARSSPPTLYDVAVTIPAQPCPTDASGNPLALNIPASITRQLTIPGNVASVHQVVADPDSSLAFITYAASSSSAGAPLPYYQIAPGTIASIPLAGAATAPVAGIFSPDNNLFFVGTAGDNLVHYIDVSDKTKPPADVQQINPRLLDGSGNPVPPQFLAVRPRPTT